MIDLIAQATPPAASPLSAWAILYLLAGLVGTARILYILDGDLKGTQPVMVDPVGFAVQKSPAIFADISGNKWQGLRAVVMAHQLEEYLLRYGWLLKTRIGYGLCLVFMAEFVLLFVYAGQIAPDTSTQDFLAKAVAVLVLLWTYLIEKCKSMKKAVESLQVK